VVSDWTDLVKKTSLTPAEIYPILKLSEGEHKIRFLTDSPRIINTHITRRQTNPEGSVRRGKP
jgi:hypothetical protein